MTYLGLAVLFLVPVAAFAALVAWRGRLGRRWWAATAVSGGVLLVLTVVFDSLMIHADLFRFEGAHLTGVRLLLAPLEDLAWPLAAVLLLPALWELVRPRSTDRAPTGDAGARSTDGAPAREGDRP